MERPPRAIDPPADSMTRMTPAWDRTLVAAFLAAILLPGVGTLLRADKAPLSSENRTLAEAPRLPVDWSSLRQFPEAFTRYFEDHFAFRAALVNWQATLRLRWLHVSPSADVLVGRDGWFYYASDGALEDFGTNQPFPKDELETWRVTLQHTQDWLAARGITYLFVLAPDKHAVYPEFLPPSLHQVRKESRIDDLVRYLAGHSTVQVLDLRPALLDAKTKERVYHKTDTHWNDRGAFVASQQILERLRVSVPTLHSLSRDAFVPREVRTAGMDLAGMLGLTDRLSEDNLTLRPKRRRSVTLEPQRPNPHGEDWRVVTEIPASSLPRAVIFRDSFASPLIPFLSEHFSRAVYLWQYDPEPQVIERERPNVVIQEWVGRRLQTLLPYDAVAGLPGGVGVSSTSEAHR